MKHAKKNGLENFLDATKRILKAVWFILNLAAIIKTLLS